MVCRCGTCRRCINRRAQAKYQKSVKGRAALARYNQSESRRACNARYRSSSTGQRTTRAHNDRRIFVGRSYHGRAADTQTADAINAHIKERLSAFIAGQQSRAQVEALATD